MRTAKVSLKIKTCPSGMLIFGLAIVLIALSCSQVSSQQRGKEFLQKERTSVQPPRVTKIIMGYYPGWKKSEFSHSLIDFASLTHLAHAFTRPDSEGNLVIDQNYLYPELVSAAHSYSVKVIMSIGGWGNCQGFPPTAASPEKRSRFIGQIVDFCRENNYDGVDLDWEFVSGEQEKQNFSDLVRELSTALRAMDPPRLLTMAAPAGAYWGRWIDYEQLHPYFDYIAMMTYDYHGPWTDHSGHNSPLYTCQNDPCGSLDDSFSYAVIREIPPDKLLLGIPFYGRSFNTGRLYTPATQSQYYTYTDIQKLLASGWKYNWDFCSQVPFLLSPSRTTLLSFDDIRSVFRKCRYVQDKGLAGVIIWEITADRNNGRPELLQTIARTFRAGQK